MKKDIGAGGAPPARWPPPPPAGAWANPMYEPRTIAAVSATRTERRFFIAALRCECGHREARAAVTRILQRKRDRKGFCPDVTLSPCAGGFSSFLPPHPSSRRRPRRRASTAYGNG